MSEKDKPTPHEWILSEKLNIVKGSSYYEPKLSPRQCAGWIMEYVKKYYE
jgi:hypothetical protein